MNHWQPYLAIRTTALPDTGTLVALGRRVWSVTDVDPVPRRAWTSDDHALVALNGPSSAPQTVALRLWGTSGGDRSVVRCWPGWSSWWVYPSGHIPVCAACGEPMPCRHLDAGHVARVELARAERYSRPGICPCCGNPVDRGQPRVEYATNLHWPGGPPVRFHSARRLCARAARRYAEALSARPPLLSGRDVLMP